MITKELIELSDEKLQEIYTDKKFRNTVAFAHGCADRHGAHKYKKTCSFPVEYIVTDEQIKAAQEERARDKAETLKNLGNKLVFVGMGMTYESRFDGDLCNHRIRTEFQNPEGRRFFIEVGTGLGSDMRIDHSIDRGLEDLYNRKADTVHARIKATGGFYSASKELLEERDKWMKQPYYNYKDLERTNVAGKYTKENLLRLVNKYFDCNFQEIEVDNYTLRTEDFICKSPKQWI